MSIKETIKQIRAFDDNFDILEFSKRNGDLSTIAELLIEISQNEKQVSFYVRKYEFLVDFYLRNMYPNLVTCLLNNIAVIWALNTSKYMLSDFIQTNIKESELTEILAL